MALNGSFQTNTYTSTSYPSFVIVTWSATQNINNNTSTISWKCIGGSTGTSTAQYTMTGPVRIWINGTQVLNRTDRFELKKDATVGSGSITIGHNEDGTKTASVKVEANIHTGASNSPNSTYSGSITFNQIFRGIMRVRNSTWKQGLVWVKVSGSWKRATGVFVKQNGNWKRSK